MSIIFLAVRTAHRWKYDSYESLISDLASLCLCDRSQILCNPHLGTSFFLFRKESNEARTQTWRYRGLGVRTPPPPQNRTQVFWGFRGGPPGKGSGGVHFKSRCRFDRSRYGFFILIMICKSVCERDSLKRFPLLKKKQTSGSTTLVVYRSQFNIISFPTIRKHCAGGACAQKLRGTS